MLFDVCPISEPGFRSLPRDDYESEADLKISRTMSDYVIQVMRLEAPTTPVPFVDLDLDLGLVPDHGRG